MGSRGVLGWAAFVRRRVVLEVRLDADERGAGACGTRGGQMSGGAVLSLFAVVASLGGGVAWASHSDPDVVHLCSHPRGMVRVVDDPADRARPNVVLDVATSSAVEALQLRTSVLEDETATMESRIAALEARLGAEFEPSGTWTFPGNVTVEGSLLVDGSIAAGGDAAVARSLSVGQGLAVGDGASIGSGLDVGDSVSVGGDAAVAGSLAVGADLQVGGSVAAGGDVTAGGDFVDGSSG